LVFPIARFLTLNYHFFVRRQRMTLAKSAIAIALLTILTPARALAWHDACEDLHAAAFLDEPAELRQLLEHDGIDLECRDVLHQTPLITATDGASLEIVEMLVAHGVNLNARDEIGETALTKARNKLASLNVPGGETYRKLYRRLISVLTEAGAAE